uniref:Uncharacterized protein LOC104238555 n=1 Tax=Nicotiana sylvestris TaxID=4096 RepID=A0A1U7XGP8_NICSY|nr:PREDICTED: uncharacterized protein LOC104238555 [Nicotiana sylvestris]
MKGFGVICKPLTELTKKNNFKWSPTADAAFAELKKALTKAPVLALPDATKTFTVETDAKYKKGVENEVVDALSRVTRVALLALTLSPHNNDLLHSIVDGWNSDQELRQLIEELQLRRKGKLVVGKVPELRKEIIITWHAGPQGGHSGVEATLKRVQFHTSSAYHPQSDGQTKVLNRSLETYLRCYCNEDATNWYSCLPMPEYWYNTSFLSAIQTTPYKALYGRPPPLHLPYLLGESSSTEVKNTLINKELKIQLLKYHLRRAQVRMK